MKEEFVFKYKLFDNNEVVHKVSSFDTTEEGDCYNYWEFCRDFGKAIGYSEETINKFFGFPEE